MHDFLKLHHTVIVIRTWNVHGRTKGTKKYIFNYI